MKKIKKGDYQNSSSANDSFYLFFLNMKQMTGFKGYAYYAIRELIPAERDVHCNSSEPGQFYYGQNKTIKPPVLETLNFTGDFEIRTFSSGCFYYSEDTGFWQTEGMEILADSNVSVAHCVTEHLTSFAGGFIVLPPEINFSQIWANADFLKNPTIYSTVIVITGLLIIGSVIAHLYDRRDKRKMKLTALSDNSPDDTYYYEVIAFTGGRKGAATDSNVTII